MPVDKNVVWGTRKKANYDFWKGNAVTDFRKKAPINKFGKTYVPLK